MNFNKRLIWAFILPAILFIAGLGSSLLAQVQTQAEFGQYIAKEQVIVQGVRDMYAQGLQMGQALRNVVLDPENPKAFQNLETARGDFDNAFQSTQAAAQGTSLAPMLSEVAQLRAQQAKAQDAVLAVARSDSDSAKAKLNSEETPAWRSLKGRLLEMDKAAAQLSDARYQAVVRNSTRSRWTTLGLALLAVVVAMAMGWFIRRTLMREIGGDPADVRSALSLIASGDLSQTMSNNHSKESLMGSLVTMQGSMRELVQQVQQSSENIQVSTAEVALGNQDLSARTEQAASNLEETAASMEELTSTVSQSADAARQANQLATSASEVAVRGGQVVSQVVSTMEEINQSSKKISDIIGVIDGIAFQTNILALNAAVEAARAGEQGRGFAVVASEVRSLAQRSAEAAKEIKGLIGASVDKVDAGSRLVSEAGQTMSEIVGSVQRVTDIIGEITAASGEQRDGIAQVNTAVNQLDQMTQQNAALVEQSAAAAESLKDQATRLAQVVQVFRLGSPANGGTARLTAPEKMPATPFRTEQKSMPTNASKSIPRSMPMASIQPAKAVGHMASKTSKSVAAPVRSNVPSLPSKPVTAPKVLAKSGDESDWESF
jgi:methyl-accepting chemotaxis protein